MSPPTLDLDKAALGILALMTAAYDRQVTAEGNGKKAEVVLADAGFTISEIVQVTGRKYETVKTSLRRARGKAESAPTRSEEG
jgi:hypothetical protein